MPTDTLAPGLSLEGRDTPLAAGVADNPELVARFCLETKAASQPATRAGAELKVLRP